MRKIIAFFIFMICTFTSVLMISARPTYVYEVSAPAAPSTPVLDMVRVEPKQIFTVGTFNVTAYSPFDDRNGINSYGDPSITSTGAKTGPGTMAIDPTVIPYGSEITIIYEDGTIERGIAQDTGGAIKGNRLDVFRQTFDEAMDFGVQEAIVIWREK